MFTPRVDHNSVAVVWRPGHLPGVNQMLVAYCIQPDLFRSLGCPAFEDIPEEYLSVRVPGGGGNFGESPEDTFRRELREETGLKAKRAAPLHWVYRRRFQAHVKNGFLISRSDCKGSLYKKPYWDRKTVIVGFRWCTFEEALHRFSQDGHRGSHFWVIRKAQSALQLEGIEYMRAA
ncbi:MAG: hypothetical protein JWL80_605 [Parcubacteria group bacterium]|nr:hypothetical protein [Parcubacteria group bacterium]